MGGITHTTKSAMGGPRRERREMMPLFSSVKHLEMVSKDPLYVMPRRHNDLWHHENRKLIALPKPESFAEQRTVRLFSAGAKALGTGGRRVR